MAVTVAAAASVPDVASKWSSLPPAVPAPGYDVPAQPVLQAPVGVGTLGAQTSVSDDGRSEVSIPLDVPVGPAGNQPALSLVYSSRSGNGDLGVGWSVSGAVSSIAPCGRTHAIHGTSTGVRFDYGQGPDKDRFCLDGKALVASAGNYGSDGAQYGLADDGRTRVTSLGLDELGPQRFEVSHPDGKVSEYEATYGEQVRVGMSGVASSKDVRVMWLRTRTRDQYGNVVDYRYTTGFHDGWHGLDVGQGIEVHIDRIDYSTLDPTTAEDWDRHRYVKFEYDLCDSSVCARPDPIVQWVAGTRFQVTKRLSRISMFAPRPVDTQLITRYDLGYDEGANTHRSRLRSVKKCGFLGGCLAEKLFDYTEDVPTFSKAVVEDNFQLVFCRRDVSEYLTSANCEGSPGWLTSYSGGMLQPADITGDGADDIIYQRGTGGMLPPTYFRVGDLATMPGSILPLQFRYTLDDIDGYGFPRISNLRLVDVDGDGRLDVFDDLFEPSMPLGRPGPSVYHWDAEHSPMSPGGLIVGSSNGAYSPNDPSLEWPWNMPAEFADIDGDGRPEMIRRVWDENLFHTNGVFGFSGTLKIFAGGQTDPYFALTRTLKLDAGQPWHYDNVDVDGDGRIDFLTPGKLVRPSHEYEFEGSTWSDEYSVDPLHNVYGDFNGDGLSDIAVPSWSEPLPHVDIRWNTGRGFSEPMRFADLPAWPDAAGQRVKGLRAADMNGDGSDDLVFFHDESVANPWSNNNNNGITVLFTSGNLGTGDRLFIPDAAHSMIGEVPGESTHAKGDFRYSHVGDFNGDGRTDFISFLNEGSRKLVIWQNQAAPSSKGYSAKFGGPGRSDLLLSVKDAGLAWDTATFVYAGEWSAWPRRHGVSCGYPLACVRPGLSVVREVHWKNWADPDPSLLATDGRVVEYSYEAPRSGLTGNGFLGFEMTRAWDSTRATETVTWFGHLIDQDRRIFVYPRRTRTATLIEAHDNVPQTAARITETEFEYELGSSGSGQSVVQRPTKSETMEWEEDVAVEWVLAPQNQSGSHILDIDHSLNAPAAESGRRSSTYAYDDLFGMTTTHSVEVEDGTSTTITTSYEHDEEQWFIGMPKRVEVTRKSSSGDAQTRTTEFDYNKGVPIRISIEPQDPNPAVRESTVVHYTANGSLGSVTREAVVNGELVERAVAFGYAQGYPGAPDEKIFPSVTWVPRGNSALPVLGSWAAVHPAFGVAVSTVDVNGVVSQTVIDDLGRTRKTIDPRAPLATVSYAARNDAAGGKNGIVVTTSHRTSPGTENVSTASFDGAGRFVAGSSTAFDGTQSKERVVYDELGRISRVARPYSGALPVHFDTTTYDNLGRPIARVDADGTVTQTYQYGFRSSMSADSLGNSKTTWIDADARVVRVLSEMTGEPAVETAFAYWPSGDVRTITDDGGNVSSFEYDIRGRVTRSTDPDRGAEQIEYSGFGDVTQLLHEEAGDTIDYEYDDIGRLVRRILPTGVDQYDWDTALNGIGRIAQATSRHGNVKQFSYDAFGRPNRTVTVIDGTAYGIDVEYDAFGRPRKLRYPQVPGQERFVVENVYNGLGYLSAVRDATVGGPGTQWLAIDSRNTDHSFASGVLGNGIELSRSYEASTGRLKSMAAVRPASNNSPELTLLGLQYDYYDNGLVKRIYDAALQREESFGYDSASRLRDWHVDVGAASHAESYDFDRLGNLARVVRNGSVAEASIFGSSNAGPHMLVSRQVGGVEESYAYDAKGRLREDPRRNFVYDALELPTSVQMKQTGETVGFEYDAYDARTRKYDGVRETVYVAGLYERQSTPSAITHLFQVRVGEGASVQVAKTSLGTSKTTYTIQNAAGSNVLVTDSGGNVVSRQHFDPWGATVSTLGQPSPWLAGELREGFLSQEHDLDIGLVNLNARLYDPATRRFLSVDPIAADVSHSSRINPYSYAMNSPINLSDPTGLSPQPMPCTSAVSTQVDKDTWVGDAGTTGFCSSEVLDGGSSGAGGISSASLGHTFNNTISADQRFDANSAGPSPFGAGSMGKMTPPTAEEMGQFSKGGVIDTPSMLEEISVGLTGLPILGVLFEAPYPDSPAWREAAADQGIRQNGTYELIGSVIGAVTNSARLAAQGAHGRPGGPWDVMKGMNPSGDTINCGWCSVKAVLRLKGVSPRATAGPGFGNMETMAKMMKELRRHFGHNEVEYMEVDSLLDVVRILKERGQGTTAIISPHLTIGGRVIEIPNSLGHATVVRYELDDVIRFFDFQGEKPARGFAQQSALRATTEGAGEEFLERFRMIVVD